MYGFIYIWYDRKHHRFYIGSHKGDIDDGYVCSSSWMKSAYKRRPYDFKRRILKYGHSRQELYEIEQFYLDMIKDEELGKRYYNLKKSAYGGFHENAWKKSAESNRGKKLNSEHRKKISAALSNKAWSNKRKASHTGKYSRKHVYEYCGNVIGDIHDAMKFAGKSKNTIIRWCTPSSKWFKPEWRKYYV